MPLMVKATFCRFVIVTVRGWLGVPTSTTWLNGMEVGETVTGAMPLAVNCTAVVLISEAIESVPVCTPVAAGVNVALIVHVAPPLSDAPQLVVATNPAPRLEVIVRGLATVPRFVTVNVPVELVCPSATFPNPRRPGVTVKGAEPVPWRETDSVLGIPSSAIVTVPATAPSAVGVNVIEIVQLRFAVTEVPQVSVSVKPAVAVMLVTLSAAVLRFVSRIFVVLDAPTATEPKLCEVEDSVTVCARALRAANPTNSNAIKKGPDNTRTFRFVFIIPPRLKTDLITQVRNRWQRRRLLAWLHLLRRPTRVGHSQAAKFRAGLRGKRSFAVRALQTRQQLTRRLAGRKRKKNEPDAPHRIARLPPKPIDSAFQWR